MKILVHCQKASSCSRSGNCGHGRAHWPQADCDTEHHPFSTICEDVRCVPASGLALEKGIQARLEGIRHSLSCKQYELGLHAQELKDIQAMRSTMLFIEPGTEVLVESEPGEVIQESKSPWQSGHAVDFI